MKIIGYDSDSAYEDGMNYKSRKLQKYNVVDKLYEDNKAAYQKQIADKSKAISEIIKEKNKLEVQARKNAVDREAHVYLIGGEKRYYRIYRELSEFVGYGEVKYLGIGLEPKTYQYSGTRGKTKKEKKKLNSICCYCEVTLTDRTRTREHVIPKHRGGKIIRPCCKDCNGEKGGLMLHSYIQMLNLKLEEYKPESQSAKKLMTKIRNANNLLIEIHGQD